MKKLVALFLGLWCLLTPALAFAQASKHLTAPTGSSSPITALSAVALNGAAATRTFSITNKLGFADIMLMAKYTWANNGTMTFVCTHSGDSNVTDYTPSVCTLAAGVCTMDWAGTWTTPTLTASKNFSLYIGMRGAKDVECVVTHNGTPGAGDLITVQYYAVTQ